MHKLKKYKIKHRWLLLLVGSLMLIGFLWYEAPQIKMWYRVNVEHMTKDGPWETLNGVPELQNLSNGREITYAIKKHDINTKLFQIGVNEWNKLGVIKLVPTNWSDAQITMHSNNESNANIYAYTNITAVKNGLTSATMMPSSITIYRDNQQLRYEDQLVTIRHEIGHALGFAHDNRIINHRPPYNEYRLTMYARDGKYTYPLGGLEQRMLSDMYHLAPLHGYIDNNY